MAGDRHELDDIAAIGRHVYRVGLLPQTFREHPRRMRFVLDQQDAHGDLFCANSREAQAKPAPHYGWAEGERLSASHGSTVAESE